VPDVELDVDWFDPPAPCPEPPPPVAELLAWPPVCVDFLKEFVLYVMPKANFAVLRLTGFKSPN
jgi:hypothetical protein